MNVVRGLERRLERLLDGVAGRVFSGRLHPTEIAGRLAREADLARFEHPTGPATANVYSIVVNPRDLEASASDLEETLAEEMVKYTAEEGLRLEGPVKVSIVADAMMAPGNVACHVEVAPGRSQPWARLIGDGTTLEITRNRVLVGRDDDADVLIRADDVSRRHALVWRQGGTVHVRDLGSTNGTTVDGQQVGHEERRVPTGSMLGLGSHIFQFVEI